MGGIAGIADSGKRKEVECMLNKMSHRGRKAIEIFEYPGGTMGTVLNDRSQLYMNRSNGRNIIIDNGTPGHFASASFTPEGFCLRRDQLGASPLYYGYDSRSNLCFASEVKALLEATGDINEFPPGFNYKNGVLNKYFSMAELPEMNLTDKEIAGQLLIRLENAVADRIEDDVAGAWLSGGLDSSTISALAKRQANKLFTFSVGRPGAPDLEYALEVSKFIGSEHHSIIVSFNSMLNVLPYVIYHLESFDALLVRSSITNYLVARAAADYVCEVFSGEGGDELFAGYDYLKSISVGDLSAELIDITCRLHNTALQRVDRCACAFGMCAHTPFTDPEIFDFALRIPAAMKITNGVEKWVLRRAMEGLLPDRILRRTKSKFWEGAGVGTLLLNYAEDNISNSDFAAEKILYNGWQLNSKEELLYYRIFREHFGEIEDLSWMGRTKVQPLNS